MHDLTQGGSGDIEIPSSYITHVSYASLLDIIEHSNTTISGLKTVSLLMSFDEAWQWCVSGPHSFNITC